MGARGSYTIHVALADFRHIPYQCTIAPHFLAPLRFPLQPLLCHCGGRTAHCEGHISHSDPAARSTSLSCGMRSNGTCACRACSHMSRGRDVFHGKSASRVLEACVAA